MKRRTLKVKLKRPWKRRRTLEELAPAIRGKGRERRRPPYFRKQNKTYSG